MELFACAQNMAIFILKAEHAREEVMTRLYLVAADQYDRPLGASLKYRCQKLWQCRFCPAAVSDSARSPSQSATSPLTKCLTEQCRQLPGVSPATMRNL